jgi:alpha-L-rhamnosidase
VKNARLYICGLGYFTARINGQAVTDEVLAPGYTRYDKRVLYCTYDITDLIKDNNTVGITLGNGRFNGEFTGSWNLRTEPWRSIPKVIAQIFINYTDGSSHVVRSNTSWKVTSGPSFFNCINGGEYYDARLDKEGWDRYGYKCIGWNNARIHLNYEHVLTNHCSLL